MNGPSRVNHWAPLIVGLLVALVVGAIAYNLGFSHGVLQRLPAGAAVPYPWPYHPWGFGLGFLFPLLFAFLVVRALLWRGPWRRGGYGGPYLGGSYATCAPGVPPAFDEWHRRAHAKEKEQPPASTT